MHWDLIIFIAILFSFFAGLLLFVKKGSVYFAKIRAKKFGLNLTFEEAETVQKNFCIKKEFFEGTKGVWDLEKIPIEKLAIHYLSNGSLRKIQDGIRELKDRNKSVDFNIISAIDLAGRDLKNEIIDCDKEHSIHTKELKNNNLKVSINAKYKFGFPESIWADKQPELIQRLIEGKIIRFLDSWELKEPLKTEKFLRENILNINFWEKELKVVLISQELNVGLNYKTNDDNFTLDTGGGTE
jgi:hypothetical protein